MNIEAIKSAVKSVSSLREDIEALTKADAALDDYISQAYDKITGVDYGHEDRFFVPYSVATRKLQDLMDEEPEKINSAFSTHRTKLLSILSRYIKDLQRGFQQHDLEAGSVPPA